MKRWKRVLLILGLSVMVGCSPKATGDVDNSQSMSSSAMVESNGDSSTSSESIEGSSMEESSSEETKSKIELILEEENELKRTQLAISLLQDEPDNYEALKIIVDYKKTGKINGETDYGDLKKQLDEIMKEMKGEYAVVTFRDTNASGISKGAEIDAMNPNGIYI